MNRRLSEITETVRVHVASTSTLQRQTAGTLENLAHRQEFRPYGDAARAMERCARTLHQHGCQLEGELDALGGRRALDSAREALESMGPPAVGRLSALRFWPASRVVRDQALAVSELLGNLTVLHSLALARNVESVAAASARQLQDTAQLLVDLQMALSTLVVQESGRREPIAAAPDAGTRARRHVKAAWRGVARSA